MRYILAAALRSFAADEAKVAHQRGRDEALEEAAKAYHDGSYTAEFLRSSIGRPAKQEGKT